ncbi:MAG: TatD family hydrolase [Acidimicrobiia bacterium]
MSDEALDVDAGDAFTEAFDSTQDTWVDTHGHLFLIETETSVVLDRAQARGVDWLVCPGVDVPTSEASRALANRFPSTVRWAAGLHPHEAESWSESAERIAELATEAHAVGECGLDWYRNLAPRASQLSAFKSQLQIAVDLEKPIIIHCRDAFRDLYDILEDAAIGEKAVLHCWTGGTRWTKRFDGLGVTFSFAGPLTYSKGETLRLGAAYAPPERTMVETDSPYLTPEPVRGEPNEPANVMYTGGVLADVWGMSTKDVARLTSATAARLFGDPRG